MALLPVGITGSAELGDDEAQRTRTWFRAFIDGYQSDIDAIDQALPSADADDRQGLLDLRTELIGQSTRAAQTEEAFFVQKTVSLRPPPQEVIDETLRLTEALARRIASHRRAQAVVRLVNDLADLFIRVTKAP